MMRKTRWPITSYGKIKGGNQHPGFAQLDLLLLPAVDLQQVRMIRSDCWEGLASHHFLLEVFIAAEVEKVTKSFKKTRRDISALKDPGVRRDFAT